MTAEHAARLWAEALPMLTGDRVGVDLSAVDRLDTAGCQILLACRREADRRGAAWELTGGADHVNETLHLLGCGGALGLDAPEEKGR